MTFPLVGIGELLWDIFPTGKELGGAPANFAYHASALGGEGLIVSGVGSDSLGDERQLLGELSRRFNLELVAITKGASGSLLYSRGQISVHDGYQTEVGDTVGSRDAFTAALALGMLAGSDLGTINDYANRVASFVCSKRGATPPLSEDLKITR